jgi:hypothetical protein
MIAYMRAAFLQDAKDIPNLKMENVPGADPVLRMLKGDSPGPEDEQIQIGTWTAEDLRAYIESSLVKA